MYSYSPGHSRIYVPGGLHGKDTTRNLKPMPDQSSQQPDSRRCRYSLILDLGRQLGCPFVDFNMRHLFYSLSYIMRSQ